MPSSIPTVIFGSSDRSPVPRVSTWDLSPDPHITLGIEVGIGRALWLDHCITDADDTEIVSNKRDVIIWMAYTSLTMIISMNLRIPFQLECLVMDTQNPSKRGLVSSTPNITQTVKATENEVNITHTYPVRNLWSSTLYTCYIRAVNRAGQGQTTNITFWTQAEGQQYITMFTNPNGD